MTSKFYFYFENNLSFSMYIPEEKMSDTKLFVQFYFWSPSIIDNL